MPNGGRPRTRQEQAFDSLLAPDLRDQEPTQPNIGKVKGAGRDRRRGKGQEAVPGFRLREDTQASGASTIQSPEAQLAELCTLFNALDARLVAAVVSAAGSADAALGPLAELHAQARDKHALPGGATHSGDNHTSAAAPTHAGDNYWDWLPGDVKELIMARLSLKDVAIAARTSQEFAAHVRQLRASVHSLVIPAGLSYNAVRGMVAAHVGATAVSLTRWDLSLRNEVHFESLLGAVGSGSAERWHGRPVGSISLMGCQHLSDAGVVHLCEELPDLREVNLANCPALTDAALLTLSQHPHPGLLPDNNAEEDGMDDDGFVMAGQLTTCLDDDKGIRKETERPQQPRAVPGSKAALRAEVAAVVAWREARRQAIVAASQDPHAGGLRSISLANCTAITDAGVRALLQGARTRATLRHLDVTGCPLLTGKALAGALTTLKAARCLGIAAVSLQLPNGCSLEELSLADCRSLAEATVSSDKLTVLNLSGCDKLQSLSLVCPALRELKASMCRRLPQLGPAFACLRLQHLSLYSCRALSSEGIEEALATLPELRSLDMNGATDIQRLLLSHNTALESLEVQGCQGLTQLICASPRLTRLQATGCARLVEVVLQSKQPSLALELRNCGALRAVGLPLLQAAWAAQPPTTKQPVLSKLDVAGCDALPPDAVAGLRALLARKPRR